MFKRYFRKFVKLLTLLRIFLPKFIKVLVKNFYYRVSKNYHTSKLVGDKKKYLDLFKIAIRKQYPKIDYYLKKNNLKKIDRDFINKLALVTQVSIKKSSINFQHGRIIYGLICKYISNCKEKNIKFNFVDIGTAKGFSSIVISKAAYDCKVEYEVQTYDIIPNNVKMYWNSISDFKGKQTRAELVSDYRKFTKNINYYCGVTKISLQNNNKKRIHFAFIDGSHDYQDVFFEYNFIKQRQLPGDIIMFDDITPKYFRDLVLFIKKIKKQKQYHVNLLTSEKNRGYAVAYKL